jgi:cobalt-zinc-cadmium efflux system outer membrane protein
MKLLIYIILLSFFSQKIFSEGDSHTKENCLGDLKILQVVECVLDHSPEYKVARFEIGAMEGKKRVAGYLFPSNPYITITQAGRKGSGGDLLSSEKGVYYNGEAMVSQEIFMSSQRSIRLKIAGSELSSAEKKLLSVERNTIAEALNASVIYQFAKEETLLYQALYKISDDIFRVIRTRSEKGLSPPIESDLAESEKLKAFHLLQIAKRNQEKAKINLTVMMGVGKKYRLEITDTIGEPKYIKQRDEDLLEYALSHRPEVESLDFLVQASSRKLDLLYKEKIPNPVLSAYFQKDGFNENVIGGRVSMPLRVWRDQSGEIQESKYRVEQVKSVSEVNRHTITMEVLKASNDFESLKSELETYSPELLKKVEINIDFLKKALMQGQVNLKEALLLQQSFLNLKVNLLGTRLQFALSGIELIRASGYPMISYKEVVNE